MAWKEPRAMPYPPTLDRLMRRIDRRYLAALISTFMLIPAIVTFLSDWLGSDGVISWSLYVIGAGLMLATWVVVPLLASRYRLLTFLTLDCLAAIAYLFAIERIAGQDWFLPLALPMALAACALLLLCAYFFRKPLGRRVVYRIVACLSSTGIMAMVVEITVDLYVNGALYLNWSPYVLSTCLITAGVLLILNSKKRLKEEIRKRMFY